MRVIIGLVSVGMIMAGTIGCSSSKHEEKASLRGVSTKQAAEMEARRNTFESSEDPPLTADTRFAAGQLAENQGATANAITQYTEATKLDARHQNSWYRLGVLHAQHVPGVTIELEIVFELEPDAVAAADAIQQGRLLIEIEGDGVEVVRVLVAPHQAA